MQPLTPREQLFVSNYLIDPIGSKAAIAAGYKPLKAKETAMRLLKKPHIREAIAAAQAVRSVNMQIKAEDVLGELARIGFADITGYFDDNGKLKPMSEWPQNGGKLIASVKTKEYLEGSGEDAKLVQVTELKLWDKVAALDKLAKHFGLLIEHRELKPEDKIASMTISEIDKMLAETIALARAQVKANKVN